MNLIQVYPAFLRNALAAFYFIRIMRNFSHGRTSFWPMKRMVHRGAYVYLRESWGSG